MGTEAVRETALRMDANAANIQSAARGTSFLTRGEITMSDFIDRQRKDEGVFIIISMRY